MKTLITSKGDSTDSFFDLRFGRGKYFCIYDDESGKLEFIKNENAEAQGGGGAEGIGALIDALGATNDNQPAGYNQGAQ